MPYVYLAQGRVDPKEPLSDRVFKVGRTDDHMLARAHNYPPGTVMEIVLPVHDSVAAETDLLKHFRLVFAARADMGRETFDGDRGQILHEFLTVYQSWKLDHRVPANDYSQYTMEKLFELARKRNLPITGDETKAVLYKLLSGSEEKQEHPPEDAPRAGCHNPRCSCVLYSRMSLMEMLPMLIIMQRSGKCKFPATSKEALAQELCGWLKDKPPAMQEEMDKVAKVSRGEPQLEAMKKNEIKQLLDRCGVSYKSADTKDMLIVHYKMFRRTYIDPTRVPLTKQKNEGSQNQVKPHPNKEVVAQTFLAKQFCRLIPAAKQESKSSQDIHLISIELWRYEYFRRLPVNSDKYYNPVTEEFVSLQDSKPDYIDLENLLVGDSQVCEEFVKLIKFYKNKQKVLALTVFHHIRCHTKTQIDLDITQDPWLYTRNKFIQGSKRNSMWHLQYRDEKLMEAFVKDLETYEAALQTNTLANFYLDGVSLREYSAEDAAKWQRLFPSLQIVALELKPEVSIYRRIIEIIQPHTGPGICGYYDLYAGKEVRQVKGEIMELDRPSNKMLVGNSPERIRRYLDELAIYREYIAKYN